VLGLAAAACDRTTKGAAMTTAEDVTGRPRQTAAGVTFSVEAPQAQSVHLAGTFNNWSTSADPMKKGAGGRWTIIKPLPPGSHQYKFVIDGGSQWLADPANPEGTDDGFGGKNSLVTVGAGGAAVAPQAAAAGAAASGAAGAGPEKVAGGWRFGFDQPAARSVHLAGSFNNWSTSADAMQKGADGRWTLVKDLPAGSHQYKFVIDGSDWKTDPANPNSTDDGFGGKNSLLTVGAAGAAVAPAAAAPAAAAPAPTTPAAAGGGPTQVDGGWRFSVDLPAAQSVHLAGSFNGWSTSADPMTKDAQGRWTLVKNLPAGSHQYKFVIDGGKQWQEDAANPNGADDGYGGKNSLLVVP
jgi:1,4-alpha-glucan branching enzyme